MDCKPETEGRPSLSWGDALLRIQELQAEIDAIRLRLQEVEKEAEEQARLNGMGSKREARLMDQLQEEESKRVNEYANAKRIIDWITDPNRKSAIHAFTAGPERQIAYAFERVKGLK